MRVAVIGTGYLGRTVVANFENRGAEVLHTYNSRKYFDDSIQFDLFFQNLPDTILLAEIDVVVFTSMIEDSSNTEAVLGAMRRAFLSCRDKRVVYISTDAVFDGQKGMYVEKDSPNPQTPYGMHKKLCEDMLCAIVPNSCVVRPSYIFGFSLGQLDNRLNKARALAQNGQRIKKFIDMFKSSTEVNQLAEIISTVSTSDFRGVLHACGKRLSVHDFFKQALAVLGERTDLLESDCIPENAPSEYLVDTSLDSSLLRKEFGFKPTSMEVALGNPKKEFATNDQNQV